jgi:hypothetical protein
MGANTDTGAASNTEVEIETDMSGVGNRVLLAAVIAETHRARTNTPITVDALGIVDFNNVREFFHR